MRSLKLTPIILRGSISSRKRKNKSIITDFILSVEIVIIALGSVEGKPIATQIMVVTYRHFSHRRRNCCAIVRMDDLEQVLMLIEVKT
jgi:predicted DNA repair protein MutK